MTHSGPYRQAGVSEEDLDCCLHPPLGKGETNVFGARGRHLGSCGSWWSPESGAMTRKNGRRQPSGPASFVYVRLLALYTTSPAPGGVVMMVQVLGEFHGGDGSEGVERDCSCQVRLDGFATQVTRSVRSSGDLRARMHTGRADLAACKGPLASGIRPRSLPGKALRRSRIRCDALRRSNAAPRAERAEPAGERALAGHWKIPSQHATHVDGDRAQVSCLMRTVWKSLMAW